MKLKEVGHILAEEHRIVVGEIYVYACSLPRGCKGGHYRVEGLIVDLPSKQEKVLVKCLTGKEKGLWFCCSPSAFSYSYEPLPPPAEVAELPRVAEPVPAKEIVIQEGAGY